MKKIFLSSALVIAFAVYVIYQHMDGPGYVWYSIDRNSGAPTNSNIVVSSQNTPTTSTPPPQPSPKTKTTRTPKPTGLYKDGTYTGSVADAYYGNVQVQVTVQGGAISNVQFLDYPHDRSTSNYINSQATPLLAQEAIQTQNAQVDIVSGATETSLAFRESLASALTQAAN